jgi:hypothetical protein
MEIDGNYYCPGNIVITQGGEAISVANPEEGLLIDYFYIDKKNKTIETCADIKDSFVDGLKEIEKIEVVKSEDENVNRLIKVYLKDIEEPVLIGIDKNNQIVKYKNKNITNIADYFLSYNKELTELELPNLTEVGCRFLMCNKRLTKLELPKLKVSGGDFLAYNQGLTELELPNLTEVGENFLENNQGLTKLELPNLTEAGYGFLRYNEELTQLELPNAREKIKKRLGDIIDRNMRAQESKNKEIITAKDIAQLDKDSELTTSEISLACGTIEKNIQKIKDDREK